jgi:hypothetical protein
MLVVPLHTGLGPVIEQAGRAFTVTAWLQVLLQPVVVFDTVRLNVEPPETPATTLTVDPVALAPPPRNVPVPVIVQDCVRPAPVGPVKLLVVKSQTAAGPEIEQGGSGMTLKFTSLDWVQPAESVTVNRNVAVTGAALETAAVTHRF